MPKDKFSGRLMIPIFNKDGAVVGFTGRTFPFDKIDRPKYLNSPDSDWFRKGDLWYGYNFARTAIRKEQEVIIVEGNMDVIAAHKYGLINTIASQGTAVTENQIKQLKFLTNRVLLAFDNDNAGYISGNKFFQTASNKGLQVERVLIPNKYKDIDEYLSSEFKLPLTHPIRLETKPYLDYILARNYVNLISSNSQVQRESIIEFCELIAPLDDLTIEQTLPKLAKATGISINTLNQIVNSIKAKQNKYEKRHDAQTSDDTNQVVDFKISSHELNKQDQALVAWQKLVAVYDLGKLTSDFSSKIPDLFVILRFLLFNSLQEFESLEKYVQAKQAELNLIQEEIDFEITPNGQTILWRNLINFVNSSQVQLSLNSDLKESFEKIQGRT